MINNRGHRASICTRACSGIPDSLLENPEYLIKAELDSLDSQISMRLKTEELLNQSIEHLEKIIYYNENGGEPYAGRDARDAAKAFIKRIKN